MQGNKSPEIGEVLCLSAFVQCVRVLRMGCDVVIMVKQWLVPGCIPWERTKKYTSRANLSIHFFVNLNYFVPIFVTHRM